MLVKLRVRVRLRVRIEFSFINFEVTKVMFEKTEVETSRVKNVFY